MRDVLILGAKLRGSRPMLHVNPSMARQSPDETPALSPKMPRMSGMRYVRASVFLFAAILTGAVYVIVRAGIPSHELQEIRLAELYGALSLAFLYVAMAVSPLYSVFPALPGRATLYRARRAIGVCAFCLGLLHTWVAFFDLLAGWEGMAFLSDRYWQDLVRSAAALAVLFVLAATSNDWAVERLGSRWKWLHRLLYAAGAVVLLHSAVLGSHFVSPASPAWIVTFVLVAALIVLEGMRLDRWMAARSSVGNLGAGLALSLFGVAAAAALIFFGENSGFNIHSTHAIPYGAAAKGR